MINHPNRSKKSVTSGKHTPGPWTKDYYAGYGQGHIFSDNFPKNCIGGREAFAICHIPGIYDALGRIDAPAFEMMEANAQLIATAPDMLEALELALRALQITGYESHLHEKALKAVSAAISKAKGR